MLQTLTPLHRELVKLREEHDVLREENRQLREAGTVPRVFPAEWSLTARETDFLSALYNTPGVATRDRLMIRIYGYDYTVDPKTLDVYIFHIRRKIAPFGLSIETVWGRGWMLAAPVRERIAEALRALEAPIDPAPWGGPPPSSHTADLLRRRAIPLLSTALSTREIAIVLGMTPDGVRQALKRAAA